MMDTHHIYADTMHMDLFYQGKNHVYEAEAVTICMDGKPLTAKDMPAIIIDERTMLPMRLIAEALGAEVAWNEDANQVYVINDTNTIVFQIDDKTGYQNGNTFTMDVPPMIVNERTMLPVRALANALDLDVTWDEKSRTVFMQTKTPQPTEPPTDVPPQPTEPPTDVPPQSTEPPADVPPQPTEPPADVPPQLTEPPADAPPQLSANLKNMVFDKNQNILYLQKEQAFNIQDVAMHDHYLEGYFEIVLPNDYQNTYGDGTYTIAGDAIDNISVSTQENKTILRFYQNRISTYHIENEGDRYAIYAKNPKDVYQKVLLLDAGHGGKDPGTNGNGLLEKDMTLAIMQKVAAKLENSDIHVYLTRNSDVYPENNVRAKTANQIADMMVSIHMNSGPVSASGTEVLYQIHTNDVPPKMTSKKLSEILQQHIVTATGNINRNTKHWETVLILNQTTVPTALIEVGFLTNPGDALKISNPEYQDTVAQAIADGIQEAMQYPLR